ncbi:tyrosinase family oxidase copper chaperone [Micromonospora sp. WMMD558]|uniref:tyrosinase family oxidase copper chaperone n=1 Tax=unclassified Micromonospora TaxID=2617518 RepID=UPI0018AF8A04|nr:tyrosinase family oxidase copper chaperone [Micromonospora sp. WMMC415]
MAQVNRREVLRVAAAAAVSAGSIMGVTRVADATERPAPARPTPDGTGAVTEAYRGRRISIGAPAHAGHRHGTAHGLPAPAVRIDDVDLHVMANADGSYVSAVHHYRSFEDLRTLARAAVDDLDGARLIPLHG